jgi:hypothetical protein
MAIKELPHITGAGITDLKGGKHLTIAFYDNAPEKAEHCFTSFIIDADEFLPFLNLLAGLGVRVQKKCHIDLHFPTQKSSDDSSTAKSDNK